MRTDPRLTIAAVLFFLAGYVLNRRGCFAAYHAVRVIELLGIFHR
jgi:hypothetical protein